MIIDHEHDDTYLEKSLPLCCLLALVRTLYPAELLVAEGGELVAAANLIIDELGRGLVDWVEWGLALEAWGLGGGF